MTIVRLPGSAAAEEPAGRAHIRSLATEEPSQRLSGVAGVAAKRRPQHDHADLGHPAFVAGGAPHPALTANAVPPAPEDDAPHFPWQSAAVPVLDEAYAGPLWYREDLPEAPRSPFWTMAEAVPEVLTWPVEPLSQAFAEILHAEHVEPHTPLSDVAIGLQPIPERPPLILELNGRFLGQGFLSQGIEIPTGAVWRPSLWVFGTYRTGLQYFDDHAGTRVSEWAQRLDLFGQLNLSGTERILVGLRPFDEEVGPRRVFTSYDLRGGDAIDGWNADVQTLFFEGDFGEIFPGLDPYDTRFLDYGFSVGRQPLLAQQGLLINEDMLDAVTVTRNTLSGHGVLNTRISGVYAWNRINRSDNDRHPDAQLIALLTETDLALSTVNADVAYVNSDTPGASLVAFGVSAIQRIAGYHQTYNTSFHFLASFPTDGETPAAGQGELLFSQISWTPHHSEDLVYLNGFWAIDQFSSAARGPLAGGPLGQTGILFTATGLGRFGAPLSNAAEEVVGASLGYQMFFDETRQQVIFEIGGRKDTNDRDDGAIATGLRYQRAIGQHWILILDGFVAKRESFGVSPGARIELLAKF